MSRLNIERILFASLLVATAVAGAQQITGSISGYVTDQQQAMIPGATVTVSSADIGIRRQASSSEEGYFRIASLPVGTYQVRVEKAGFRPLIRESVRLDVGGQFSTTFQLGLGEVAEAVTVSEQAVQTINLETANSETLIQGKQVTELALNGRNWAQLINLAPGTSPILNDSQQGTNVRIDDTAINGLRRRTAPTLDGAMNIVHGSSGSLINNISVDAIEEFKLVSTPYSAEYGGQAGPAVNVVTKRGANRIRGSLFEFFRHDALNAYSWESKQATAPLKPYLRFNSFGYFVGGPIKKDKLFFFGGEEWKKPRTGRTVNTVVPSLAMRSGDFSELLPAGVTATSCAQAGVICDKSASTAGVPFAGNRIPQSKMSPSGFALAQIFPRPNTGNSGYIAAPVTARDVRNDLLRLDYNHSERISFFGRYLRDRFNSDSDLGNIFDNQSFPVAPDKHVRIGATALLSSTQVISPVLINEVAVMLQRNDQNLNYRDPKDVDRTARGVNFVELYPANRLNRFPEVTVQGFIPTDQSWSISGMGLPYIIRSRNTELRDNLTKLWGRHNLKTGFTFTNGFNNENFRARDGGQITFSTGSQAATLAPQDSGNALANMLLGAYARYSEPSLATSAPSRFNQFEVYINDQWKVTPRLTLTLGLRFQYIPWPSTDNLNIVGFDGSRFDPAKAPLTTISATGTVASDIAGGIIRLIPDPSGVRTRAQGYYDPYNGLVVAGCAPDNADANLKRLYQCRPSGLADSGKNGWAPRFGFAWDPWGDGRTSIRGGAGVYYDRTLLNPLRDASNNPPFAQVATLTNGRQSTTPASLVPTFGNPLDTVGPVASNVGYVQTLALFDPVMKPGAVYSYSLGVQRQLPGKSVAELAYVGNQARHLTHRRDFNFVLPVVGAVRNPAGNFVNATADLVRQFPGYSAIRMQENTGSSNYNSLQASFQKRVSHGFTASAAYTWSKALNNFDVETSDQQVPFDRAFDYGPANFDRTHVFSSSYVWELPWRQQRRDLTGSLLGGWQVSGVMSWQTGLKADISGGARASTSPSNGFGKNVDTVSDWRAGQTVNQWVNPAAFAPRIGLVGATQRNLLALPRSQNWNFSLMKRIQITERVRLQFRAEIFNLFNHSNFRTLATNLSNSDFGKLRQTDDPRVVQFGLKLYF